MIILLCIVGTNNIKHHVSSYYAYFLMGLRTRRYLDTEMKEQNTCGISNGENPPCLVIQPRAHLKPSSVVQVGVLDYLWSLCFHFANVR